MEHLNALLIIVDFKKLNVSCNSTDDSYAKDILKKMHDIFTEVYKTDYLDSYTYEFVKVPAIIRGRNTIFYQFLYLEKLLFQIEKKIHSDYCDNLVLENAALRTIINGKLISMLENFYDLIIAKNFPENDYIMT